MIKKGDTIYVTNGKERGKTGRVLKVFRDTDRVLVEGINLYTKHVRPKRQGQKGETIQQSRSLNLSNVIVVCPRCGKHTRVAYTIVDKEKSRVCRKCGGVL